MKNAEIQNSLPIPPQDLELESVVLGAILIDGNCLHEVIGLIHSKELFYKIENQIVFEAIASLFNSGRNVDLLTVSNEIKHSGKKLELTYVNELTFRVNSSANIVRELITCDLVANNFSDLANKEIDLFPKALDEKIDPIF